MRLFLDTNILLDATYPGRLHAEDAQMLLDRISSGSADAYMASFSVATIVYFLQKAFKSRTAFIIEQLLVQIKVVGLGKEDFLAGGALGFTDLEDAYQYIAATKAGSIDYIVTQNVKDFKQSGISVIRPREVLKVL